MNLGFLILPLLLSASAPPSDFEVARPGYRFEFPRDHGAHPGFRTEWWYLTGHLWEPRTRRRFGYQLTFFRQALPPSPWKGSPAWGTGQLHLAHAAITDVGAGAFRMEERLNREGLAAGAAPGRLALFNDGWRLEADARGTLHLSMGVKGARLTLSLEARTAPVIFGEDGVSRKGPEPGAASHYVTLPRLEARGTLSFPGSPALPVEGLGWLDHEFASHPLGSTLVGWDWAALQFEDGTHLMAYRLRRADGSQEPCSSLTQVDAAGRILRSTRDFRFTGTGTWTSPRSRAVYPQPALLEAWGRRWSLRPLVRDQELQTPRSTRITYWEGACEVLDESGKTVGAAYLEQTGYAHSLQGRF